MFHTASLVKSPSFRKSQVLVRERATTVVLLNGHCVKLPSKYLLFLYIEECYTQPWPEQPFSTSGQQLMQRLRTG